MLAGALALWPRLERIIFQIDWELTSVETSPRKINADFWLLTATSLGSALRSWGAQKIEGPHGGHWMDGLNEALPKIWNMDFLYSCENMAQIMTQCVGCAIFMRRFCVVRALHGHEHGAFEELCHRPSFFGDFFD